MTNLVDLTEYKHENAEDAEDADVKLMLKELLEEDIKSGIFCYINGEGEPEYYAAGQDIQDFYKALGLLERIKVMITEGRHG